MLPWLQRRWRTGRIVVVKYFFRVDSFRPGFASEGGGSLVDAWIHEWCCERVSLAGD